VVPERYQIVSIVKCDHSLALDFGNRENMFQNIGDSLAKLSAEIIENQMWVNFGHVRQLLVYIMPENYILQSEIHSGANRQMADNHAVRLPSMLMQNHNICQVFIPGQPNQILYNVSSSVDSFGVGQNDRHFLQKLSKARRGISRCGDQNLRIGIERVRVFVVDVASRD
jgi:hypothetical protein